MLAYRALAFVHLDIAQSMHFFSRTVRKSQAIKVGLEKAWYVLSMAGLIKTSLAPRIAQSAEGQSSAKPKAQDSRRVIISDDDSGDDIQVLSEEVRQ